MQPANLVNQTGGDHQVEAPIDRIVQTIARQAEPDGQRVIFGGIEAVAALMGRYRRAGHPKHFQRADDSIEIVDRDSRRRFRIGRAKLRVQMRRAALGRECRQLGANRDRRRRAAEDSPAQDSQVQAAAACDDNRPVARDDLSDSGAGPLAEARNVTRLAGRENVYKMMGYAAALPGRGLGRPDIHPAVQQARIRVDDFGAQPLGYFDRQRRFARTGRPDDQPEADLRACAS